MYIYNLNQLIDTMKNKLLSLLLLISAVTYAQMPVEGFEGGTFPPEEWNIYDNGVGTGFSWTTIDIANSFQPPYEGNYAAFIDNENVPDGTVAQDWLVTPLIQISGTLPGLFFYSRQTLNGDQGGTYKVMMSTDTDPSNLESYTVVQQWTEPELNPTAQEYNEIFVPVPVEMVGQQAYFAFVMEGDNADRWLIDNVSFLEEGFCFKPINFSITDITYNSATISWTGHDETLWEVEVLPLGTDPTGEGMEVSETTFTATGLDMGQYEFYVHAMCSEGDESSWAGPFYFSNLNSFDGVVNYDSNGDEACDTVIPNAEVIITINDEQYSVYTNAEGYYSLNDIAYETFEVVVQVNAPDGFEDSIYEGTLDFTPEEEVTINFCLPLPSPVNDLAVTLVPVNAARPGFNADYKLVVKNNGTTTIASAMATVIFNDVKLDFSQAESPYTQTGNLVTFTFSDILPFTTHTRTLELSVMPPPENIGGEILVFDLEVPVEDDNTPDDNTAVLNQEIVNSYDPNDITVHEGSEILVEQAGDYLHYTIRFQNTGTASAVNVRLENILDENLDESTFEMLASSHDCMVTREGSELEFMHSEIYLPYESDDEPGSHGYVTYRIKPVSGFGLGDIANNTAGIYFDFNPVIETNIVSTEVVNTMGTEDFNLLSVKLYPNPVKDRLYIEVQNNVIQSVEVYDINGRLCQSHLNVQDGINTTKLVPGLYFVKVKSGSAYSALKFIKE